MSVPGAPSQADSEAGAESRTSGLPPPPHCSRAMPPTQPSKPLAARLTRARRDPVSCSYSPRGHRPRWGGGGFRICRWEPPFLAALRSGSPSRISPLPLLSQVQTSSQLPGPLSCGFCLIWKHLPPHCLCVCGLFLKSPLQTLVPRKVHTSCAPPPLHTGFPARAGAGWPAERAPGADTGPDRSRSRNRPALGISVSTCAAASPPLKLTSPWEPACPGGRTELVLGGSAPWEPEPAPALGAGRPPHAGPSGPQATALAGRGTPLSEEEQGVPWGQSPCCPHGWAPENLLAGSSRQWGWWGARPPQIPPQVQEKLPLACPPVCGRHSRCRLAPAHAAPGLLLPAACLRPSL